jgi:hypothetical protein
MVATRRSSGATPAKAPAKARGAEAEAEDWASSAGVGEARGAWAIGGALGRAIHSTGTILLLGLAPQVALYL